MFTFITNSLTGTATLFIPPAGTAAPRSKILYVKKLMSLSKFHSLHAPILVILFNIKATGFGELLFAVLEQLYSILYFKKQNTVNGNPSSQL